MNSRGFKSEPMEFRLKENGVLNSILKSTRTLGLYNPTPCSTEDASVIGYGFYGHHKKVVKNQTNVIYDGVTVIYDHTKGNEVRDFADFIPVVGELLKH